MTKFTVLTLPVAQPRPRAFANRKTGRAIIVGAVKDHPINKFKADLKIAAKLNGCSVIESGPVSMEIIAYFPRPKRLQRKKDSEYPIAHDSKPDADNICKAVMDALNGIAYKDDSQVCDIRFIKFYCAKTGMLANPQVSVEIR